MQLKINELEKLFLWYAVCSSSASLKSGQTLKNKGETHQMRLKW